MKVPFKKIISINISILTYSECIDSIMKLAKNRVSSYICVANVHQCIEAKNNKNFGKVVNSADLVLADGKPLALGIKLLYGIKQERIAGMDLLPSLLERCGDDEMRLFFYGGTEEMLKVTQEFIEKRYTSINCIGYLSPPFRPLSIQEELEVIQKINNFKPNLVFVVLGCPKQETWMHRMRGRINAPMVGIGGALPVLIGLQKRAPMWMQKYSLEWFYRFLQEPKRLFRRYLYTNTEFLISFINEYLKVFFKRIIKR
jgi:N-acetylglucosaminyldiphosphoundecaprenol N-acetyl-beta-D-mannosaminyltransferase